MIGFSNPFRRDRNRHGGGVCIYVKENIYASRCIELENDNFECVWLKINVKHKTFYFGCAYRLPNSKQEFWDYLYECIDTVKDFNFPDFYLLGDLNDNLLSTNCTLHNFINNCNLTQVIDEPTREPSNTLLDVILTNSPASMIEHGVLEPICSDHKPIFACLNFSQIRTHSFKRLVWDFRNADFISFRTKLSYMNLDFIDIIDDINIISETFTNEFMEAAHWTISNKQCVIRTKDKPWMNNEIRKQIRKRRRIHKTAKRVNTMEQWQKFKLQRNKVTSLIRKCKQDYYSRVADNLNSDHRKSTKTWWNLCKYLYTGKTNQNVIPPINFHDNILIDDIDKVEAFNSYFTSISNIANMADNLPDNVTRCASSLDNIHISNQDVIDVTKNLKPNKACGFDQISHILLK